jgi:hypothetical protein
MERPGRPMHFRLFADIHRGVIRIVVDVAPPQHLAFRDVALELDLLREAERQEAPRAGAAGVCLPQTEAALPSSTLALPERTLGGRDHVGVEATGAPVGSPRSARSRPRCGLEPDHVDRPVERRVAAAHRQQVTSLKRRRACARPRTPRRCRARDDAARRARRGRPRVTSVTPPARRAASGARRTSAVQAGRGRKPRRSRHEAGYYTPSSMPDLVPSTKLLNIFGLIEPRSSIRRYVEDVHSVSGVDR